MIIKILRFLSIISFAFTLSNCMTTEQHFRQNGLNKASFDMGCPKEKLQIIVLGELSNGNGQVGVIGCNKKASYVAVQGAGWVNNTASEIKRP